MGPTFCGITLGASHSTIRDSHVWCKHHLPEVRISATALGWFWLGKGVGWPEFMAWGRGSGGGGHPHPTPCYQIYSVRKCPVFPHSHQGLQGTPQPPHQPLSLTQRFQQPL